MLICSLATKQLVYVSHFMFCQWRLRCVFCFSHHEVQTQGEKEHQRRMGVAATLCVFKHNAGVSPSISCRLVNGTQTGLLLPTEGRDTVTSGQVKTAGTEGVFKSISHASHTHHFEGRPKTVKLILSKFPFPFGAPDIIKTS